MTKTTRYEIIFEEPTTIIQVGEQSRFMDRIYGLMNESDRTKYGIKIVHVFQHDEPPQSPWKK